MAFPAQVKPAVWGAIGGAIAAMIIGFVWGGWVTGGTSEKNARGGRANGSGAGIRAPLRGQGRAAAGAAHPLEEGELLLTHRIRGQSRMGF